MVKVELTERDAQELLIMDPMRYKILKNRKPIDMNHYKHTWRVDMLAVPKGHVEEVEMFKYTPEEQEKYLQWKSRMDAKRKEDAKRDIRMHKRFNKLIDETISHMLYHSPGYYEGQKKLHKGLLGKKFMTAMNKCIEHAKKSPYREYVRARRKLRAAIRKANALKKSQKGGKPRRHKEKPKIADVIEHCKVLATPKKKFKPAPISRGKHGEMNPVVVNRLAIPKFFVPKYVPKTVKEILQEHVVPVNTLTYNATDRIAEMAYPKVVVQPEVLDVGQVDPAALKAKATPRILELAVPKARNARVDNDFNDEAFKISPNALKYKATERIIELAKPIVRK